MEDSAQNKQKFSNKKISDRSGSLCVEISVLSLIERTQDLQNYTKTHLDKSLKWNLTVKRFIIWKAIGKWKNWFCLYLDEAAEVIQLCLFCQEASSW